MPTDKPKTTSQTYTGELKGAVMKPQTMTPSNTIAPPPAATPKPTPRETPTGKK